MASSTPSIQSFFHSQSSSPQKLSLTQPDDESTYSQFRTTVGTFRKQPWKPSADYIRYEITDLLPGPGRVCVQGRIANIFNLGNLSRVPYGAKGCLKLLVKDDTGVLTVRLWYIQPPTDLHLGQLVTLWTAHVSSFESGNMPSATLSTALCVTLFPARDRSSHLEVNENKEDCALYRLPLDWTDETGPLMSLRDFLAGDHETRDAKILVIVKSIGSRKQGTQTHIVQLGVFDNTQEATLSLFDAASTSATSFQPSHTVLLLTAIGCNSSGAKPTIYCNASTLIDVDPSIPETSYLRRLASRATKRSPIDPPFPLSIFNPQTTATSTVRALYTLADLDEQARSSDKSFEGYLSVLLTDIALTKLYGRNSLMSGECCNVPMFANKALKICKQCGNAVDLRLNPGVVGAVVDETGRIAAAGLVWSDVAWRGLFGRTPDEVARLGVGEVEKIERGLRFKRVTLVFGWAGDVDKVAIARVM
ncbi:hypothetical protein MBLNU457_g1091t2 [Dothideomycetes sp. NU457]